MMNRVRKFTVFFMIIFFASGWSQENHAQQNEFEQNPPLNKNEYAQGDSAKYPHPNTIPYKTRKSFFTHVLSFPATVWRLVWTPIGETTIWVEQNRIHQKAINFFLNDDLSAGVFPLVSLGGNTGAGAGLRAFHNNLFNRGKKINFTVLYSTSDNNSASLAYSDSAAFGSALYLNFKGEMFNDSNENLFISRDAGLAVLLQSALGANLSSLEDETSYATEQFSARVDLGYAINRKIGLGITSSLKRAEIESGTGKGGEFFPREVLGEGVTKLFSIGSTLTFDFRHGWPRTLSGTFVRFGFQINREMDGSRFKYNKLSAEIQQFVPIPFFAKNRRLAIRGRIEKLDRLEGKQIPFYELSMLGSSSTLRGYDQNRFRGKGSLLFNFEYRYPVWDAWDAVIFVDEGQVFDDYEDIRLDAFHFGIGTGLRFMSSRGFIARVEVGFSNETARALF
ncbi:MAG: BamA/TamA family outer membrane protein, partial [bacterium]